MRNQQLSSIMKALAVSTLLCLPAWGGLGYMASQGLLTLTVMGWLAAGQYCIVLSLLWWWQRPARRLMAFLKQHQPDINGLALDEAIPQWYSDQQRRYQELHDRFAARESVMDKHPDVLISLDENLRVIRGNASALRILGKGIADRPIASVLPNDKAIAAVQMAFDRKTEQAIEFTLNAPQERHFVMMVEPIAAQPLSRTRFALFLHDISAIKRAQRANADFVANASHELRTPLTALIGFIETLQGPAKNDTVAQENFLAIMHTEATRMKRMVNDLLSLSRIERRVDTPPEDTINALPVLEHVKQMLTLKAQEKRMTITVDCPLSAIHLVADADELGQVFQNILENAIKYGWDGGHIVITVRHLAKPPSMAIMPDTALYSIAFRNDGDGIAADDIPRLTERFYRTKAARGHSDGGTGLGLAIVKNILNRHQGCLQITSELGRWSCFTVLLPAADTD